MYIYIFFKYNEKNILNIKNDNGCLYAQRKSIHPRRQSSHVNPLPLSQARGGTILTGANGSASAMGGASLLSLLPPSAVIRQHCNMKMRSYDRQSSPSLGKTQVSSTHCPFPLTPHWFPLFRQDADIIFPCRFRPVVSSKKRSPHLPRWLAPSHK